MRRATLALIVLALVLGSSLLTYMVVSGYWIKLGIKVPEVPSIAVTAIEFPLNDTKKFNMTILNPSYSPCNVSVEAIFVITPDDEVHWVNTTIPWLPRSLEPGMAVNFTCYWNWANYTGQELRIVVLLREGSGATIRAVPPAVKLVLTPFLNASDPFWFLLNITNSPESPTSVRIYGIDVVLDNGTVLEDVPTEPALSWEEPSTLEPNSTLTLNCTWDWLQYRDRNFTVVAKAIEGYRGYLKAITPPPVLITITEVVFNETCPDYFNMTVFNDPSSPAPARINRVEVFVNETLFVIEDITPSISPYYLLQPNSSVVFTCYWNWTRFEGYNMTITVRTELGYVANATVNITAGVIKLGGDQAIKEGVPRSCLSLSAWRGNPISSIALRLCVPQARIQMSALRAPCRSRRSSRRGWLPRTPPP